METARNEVGVILSAVQGAPRPSLEVQGNLGINTVYFSLGAVEARGSYLPTVPRDARPYTL
jgi:hypothetical protein